MSLAIFIFLLRNTAHSKPRYVQSQIRSTNEH